jgi:hypothetical protein
MGGWVDGSRSLVVAREGDGNCRRGGKGVLVLVLPVLFIARYLT